MAVTMKILTCCLQVYEVVYHSMFQNKLFICKIRVANAV